MSFWQILILIVVAVVGAIAVKITLSFDLNKWLESRRARKQAKLLVICPHNYRAITNHDEISIQSHFNSPRGTFSYMCNQCGFWTSDESVPERLISIWANDLEGLAKRQKQFERLARKLDLM